MPTTHIGPGARTRLERALTDLRPGSPWRGAVRTALRALDEDGPARTRTLFWMHDALTGLLPPDAGDDSTEQRTLRHAAAAVADALVADHASALLAA